MSRTPQLCIRVDDDTNLCLLEERHAQELYDLVDTDRAHLRVWLPWVDYERSVEDSKAFITASPKEPMVLRILFLDHMMYNGVPEVAIL
ncbi:MAG TPA: hypothetical protein VJ761_08855 [Ktedonobacteraceae bacterium]|nr:hypothetical protein [Ktedonobacteraceae bacterium]